MRAAALHLAPSAAAAPLRRRGASRSAAVASAAAADAAPGGWPGGDEAALRAWLEAHGVRLAAWGSGSAKTSRELLAEVDEGETTLLLRDGKPLRQLSIVQLRIRDARGRTLVEASQALPDGRVRRRGVLLSEKRVRGEAWAAAARRGVAEELGRGDVALDEASHRVRHVDKDSMSYPGLRTVYEVHAADAAVPGLPEHAFQTREPRPGGDLVTTWEWHDAPPPDM